MWVGAMAVRSTDARCDTPDGFFGFLKLRTYCFLASMDRWIKTTGIKTTATSCFFTPVGKKYQKRSCSEGGSTAVSWDEAGSK
jgi:hypothetical protein